MLLPLSGPDPVVSKISTASDGLHRAWIALRGRDRRAPVPDSRVILICAAAGNAPFRHPLTPLAFLRTDRTDHGLRLPSHYSRRCTIPTSFWLAAIYVVCLCVAHLQSYSPQLSHAQPVAVLGFVLAILPSILSMSSVTACSRVCNGDVLIGFVRQVGSFM
jgi:hypothetical protein